MDNDELTSQVRLALDQEASKHRPAPDAWYRIERRLRWQPWRRGLIAGVATACIVALVIAVPQLWRTASRPPASVGNHSTVSLVVAGKFHIGKGIGDVATGYGSVWVAGFNATYRISPATGHIEATYATSGTAADSAIAAGENAVWVTDPGSGQQSGGIYRIDPRINRVHAFIQMSGMTDSAIAAVYNQVWVASNTNGGTLLRINPRNDQVSGQTVSIGPGSWNIVAGNGRLWVTSYFGNGSVMRIDPATGTMMSQSIAGASADAVGANSLWAVRNDTVQRIDPANGHVTASIHIARLATVIFWHGSAWALASPPSSSSTAYLPVRGQSGLIIRINPASDRVAGHGVPFGITPAAIAADSSGLWVVDFTNETLVHLTPA